MTTASPLVDVDPRSLWRVSPATLAYTLSGYTASQWQPAAHLLRINDALLQAVMGALDVLVISVPPQHGKSQLVSHWLPVWVLDRDPTKNVMLLTYSDDFAERWGGEVRNTLQEFGPIVLKARATKPPVGKNLLRVRLAEDTTAKGNWRTTLGGGMLSKGIGGSVTGNPADCFPAGTRVLTTQGYMDIADLSALQYKPDVLSYNHTTGALEWQSIVATREMWADELVEVVTSAGRSFRTTRDHRVFDQGQGYRQAHLLQPGDGLLAAPVPQRQDVSRVPRAKPVAQDSLLGVLHQGAHEDYYAHLSELRQDVRDVGVRVPSSDTSLERGLLLNAVQARALEGEVRQTMPSLRQAQAEQEQSLLLTRVPASERHREARTAGEGMSTVQHGVSADQQSPAVLQPSLRQCRPLSAHGQLPFQDGHELRGVVQADARPDSGTRSATVCCLSGAGVVDHCAMARQGRGSSQLDHPSHRRQSAEQRAAESDHDLPDLPCGSPQVASDTVAVVRPARTGRIRVYDIQVAGNHNFFAEGVLVHNCLLIDDPVKGLDDIRTVAQRDKLWEEFLAVATTRLSKNAPIIVIATRWHEDDLPGRIIKAYTETGQRIRVINLPAIAEEDDELGRPPGEALWEWHKPLSFLERQRAIITRDPDQGAWVWDALYQQHPIATEGAVFKPSWFSIVREDQAPDSIAWVNGWDTASSTKTSADFSACATAGFGPDGVFYIRQVRRGRWEMPDLRRRLVESFQDRSVRAHAVERDARGIALQQELKASPTLLRNVTFVAVQLGGKAGMQGDKYVRLQGWQQWLEAGKVKLVEGPWNRDFIDECLRFAPVSDRKQHDDQLDAVSVAWWTLRNKTLFVDRSSTKAVIAKGTLPAWLLAQQRRQLAKERKLIEGTFTEVEEEAA